MMKQFVLATLCMSAFAVQPAWTNEDNANSFTEAQIQRVEAALELAPADSRINFSWEEGTTRIEGSVINKVEAQAFAGRLIKAGIFGERLVHLSTEKNGEFRIEISRVAGEK